MERVQYKGYNVGISSLKGIAQNSYGAGAPNTGNKVGQYDEQGNFYEYDEEKHDYVRWIHKGPKAIPIFLSDVKRENAVKKYAPRSGDKVSRAVLRGVGRLANRKYREIKKTLAEAKFRLSKDEFVPIPKFQLFDDNEVYVQSEPDKNRKPTILKLSEAYKEKNEKEIRTYRNAFKDAILSDNKDDIFEATQNLARALYDNYIIRQAKNFKLEKQGEEVEKKNEDPRLIKALRKYGLRIAQGYKPSEDEEDSLTGDLIDFISARPRVTFTSPVINKTIGIDSNGVFYKKDANAFSVSVIESCDKSNTFQDNYPYGSLKKSEVFKSFFRAQREGTDSEKTARVFSLFYKKGNKGMLDSVRKKIAAEVGSDKTAGTVMETLDSPEKFSKAMKKAEEKGIDFFSVDDGKPHAGNLFLKVLEERYSPKFIGDGSVKKILGATGLTPENLKSLVGDTLSTSGLEAEKKKLSMKGKKNKRIAVIEERIDTINDDYNTIINAIDNQKGFLNDVSLETRGKILRRLRVEAVRNTPQPLDVWNFLKNKEIGKYDAKSRSISVGKEKISYGDVVKWAKDVNSLPVEQRYNVALQLTKLSVRIHDAKSQTPESQESQTPESQEKLLSKFKSILQDSVGSLKKDEQAIDYRVNEIFDDYKDNKEKGSLKQIGEYDYISVAGAILNSRSATAYEKLAVKKALSETWSETNNENPKAIEKRTKDSIDTISMILADISVRIANKRRGFFSKRATRAREIYKKR